jgi:hypothetical protein
MTVGRQDGLTESGGQVSAGTVGGFGRMAGR